MMLRRLQLFAAMLLALLLAMPCTQSANRYKPGKIVTNEGKIIEGELSINSGYNPANTCTFRTNKKEPPRVYQPFQIKGFRFNSGRRFISAVLPETNDSVFLRYALDGLIDLYIREEPFTKCQFLLSKDSLPLVNLRYVELPITTNFEDSTRIRSNYKHSLFKYTDDCPLMYGQVRLMKEPTYHKLYQILHRYQGLMQPEKPLRVYETRPERYPFFELGLGLNGLNHYYGFFFMPSPLLPQCLSIGIGYDSYYGIPLQVRLSYPIFFIQPLIGVGMNFNPGYVFNDTFYHWTAGANVKMGRFSIGGRFTKYFQNFFPGFVDSGWSTTLSYELH